MNYLKALWKRIKIDWWEWRAFQQSMWDAKRDKKQIKRAILRAKMKNQINGRTYFILKDLRGDFNEVTWAQVQLLKIKHIKIFPIYQDYYTMLTQCFAIVTSNEVKLNSYVETINNIIENEKTTKLSDERQG